MKSESPISLDIAIITSITDAYIALSRYVLMETYSVYQQTLRSPCLPFYPNLQVTLALQFIQTLVGVLDIF